MNTSTNLVALVTLLGGALCGVVVGTDADADALDARGQAFVEEQGCNANYELCGVEVLGRDEDER